MVLLIDTNIVLDVLLNRPEFVKVSSMIWKLCETGRVKGYISTLTYANMMYIMRKQLTSEQMEKLTEQTQALNDKMQYILQFLKSWSNFIFNRGII